MRKNDSPSFTLWTQWSLIMFEIVCIWVVKMIESVYQAVFLTSVRSLIPSLQRIKWMIMEKRRLIDRHCFYIGVSFVSKSPPLVNYITAQRHLSNCNDISCICQSLVGVWYFLMLTYINRLFLLRKLMSLHKAHW